MINITDLKLKKLLIKAIPDDTPSGKHYEDCIYNWHTYDIEKLDKINNTRINNPEYNQYLIRPNFKYLIIDTDHEKSYLGLCHELKSLNLYNEDAITISFKGKSRNLYYNRHFWFKINSDEYKNENAWQVKINGGEIFFGDKSQIAEFKDSTINKLQNLKYEDYEIIIKRLNSIKIEDTNDKYIIESDDEDEKEEYEEKPKPKKQKSEILLRTILDNLHDKRFRNYDFWIILYMIFINEKYPLEIFDEYSKKRGGKKYDKINNDKITKNIVPKEGYTIATLYFWLKSDNKDVFIKLQEKRTDLINIFSRIKNQNDVSKLYWSLNTDQYIFSSKIWYEYDKNNILIKKGVDYPTTLHNDISNKLSSIIKEQINIIVSKKETTEEDTKKLNIYNNALNNVGYSPYINGIMKFLPALYYNPEIDKLIDSNVKLFAFKNMLYDAIKKEFRPINRNDYISKTTRYELNKKSNSKIREKITSTIRGMFATDEMYTYHMQTIALSMFGNDYEAFIFNTGTGRNGKGICGQLIEESFGDYFYMGESTFYTTQFRSTSPNPTLFNLKGVRYFLITEPEADNDTKFNIGTVKKVSGKDTITTRDLRESNISYKPQFTPFLQCNKKPKVDNVDDAIKNRFKIVNFPYSFVLNPKEPHEKQIDINLKSEMDQSWYNEFMLMLIETYENIKGRIKEPEEVKNNLDEYLKDSNFLKKWLDDTFDYTTSKKDCFKSIELLARFNESGGIKLSSVKFSEFMKMNKIPTRNLGGSIYYYGLVEKQMTEEEQDIILK